jgi:hypothetical protein
MFRFGLELINAWVGWIEFWERIAQGHRVRSENIREQQEARSPLTERPAG